MARPIMSTGAPTMPSKTPTKVREPKLTRDIQMRLGQQLRGAFQFVVDSALPPTLQAQMDELKARHG